jgi:hypothetical protein
MLISLATYLKIGIDYEFDIDTARFNYMLQVRGAVEGGFI